MSAVAHPVIQRAIDEVVATFGDDHVEVSPADGGATWVAVTGRDVGEQWNMSTTAITVKVLSTYPTTPVYPFYLPAGFAKKVGGNPGNLAAATVDGRSFVQLSLNKPTSDSPETLATRIVGAIAWLRGQA